MQHAALIPTRNRRAFELLAQGGVVWDHAVHSVPETRAVVHKTQVRQLMRHHIVDHWQVEMHQPPVQANRPVGAGAAPASGGIAQAEAAPLYCQQGCKVVEPLHKQGMGLALEPGLHGALDLGGTCIGRQVNMQDGGRGRGCGRGGQ